MFQSFVRVLPALFLVLAASACQSNQPRFVPSPDAELAQLLLELKRLRGGSLDADLEDRGMRSRENEIARQLREMTLVHPRHVPTLVANAAVAYEGNDSAGAQKYLDQALRLQPDHVSATLLRVRIAAEAGNLPYALRKLKEQIQLAPDSLDLRETRAGVYFLLEDYGSAIEDLDAAERLREDGEGSWRSEYHRGLIAETLGDTQTAQDHYFRCRELNPEFEPAERRWYWLENSEPEPAG
ncbi:MAG: hypothetical protein AAF368_06885 [Planctomycetota bacterium]